MGMDMGAGGCGGAEYMGICAALARVCNAGVYGAPPVAGGVLACALEDGGTPVRLLARGGPACGAPPCHAPPLFAAHPPVIPACVCTCVAEPVV